MSKKRVFLIVLDSFGIGKAPDAALFGDEGSDTLAACAKSPCFAMPNAAKLGLFSIDGVAAEPIHPESDLAKSMTVKQFNQYQDEIKDYIRHPLGAYGRFQESSMGKDTTIGHWEIAGLISPKPMPTFPNGFPENILEEFSKRTGRGVLVNRPYSGTEVIKDYGMEHMRTGSLIVYTSADSVFQVAAHEDIVPLEELYGDCEIAREILTGPYAVGRVIARPFVGDSPENFKRTTNRHDFSIKPPRKTMCNILSEHGLTSRGVGKIYDIFAGSGITQTVRTTGNPDGIEKTLEIMDEDFEGLCFVNLVDFDMIYGHRNDVDGYAKALTYFDAKLPEILGKMRDNDILILTADHGCDPSTPSTDHSRECVPGIIYGKNFPAGMNFGTRKTYADLGQTVLAYFGLETNEIDGTSLL